VKSTTPSKKNRKRHRTDAKSRGSAQPDLGADILDGWNKAAWKEQKTWLARPRLHTGIFEEFNESIQPPDHASAEVKKSFYDERKELIEKIDGIKARLAWDDQRLTQFSDYVVKFRNDPTIERYLEIRKHFPELDVQVAFSGRLRRAVCH
jgi:hypothetical protein